MLQLFRTARRVAVVLLTTSAALVAPSAGAVATTKADAVAEPSEIASWARVDAGGARSEQLARLSKSEESGYHSCATRTDHTLWCWGSNYRGGIGDGTTTNRQTPTKVGTAESWVAVSVGGAHTCAVRAGGSLWCWGWNHTGQLGDGVTEDRQSPYRVGAATGWVGVSAGSGHTCAIRANGGVWCWGYNGHGQLGDGTTTDRHTPQRVGSAGGWATVTAGRNHTCATRQQWCAVVLGLQLRRPDR